jgi:hypothetical protein
MAAPEPYSGATLGFGVDELQQRWQEIPESLLSWLDTVTDADLDLEMPCLLPSGDFLRPTRAEILLHDLNHSTLHRGQIILMLRSRILKLRLINSTPVLHRPVETAPFRGNRPRVTDDRPSYRQ